MEDLDGSYLFDAMFNEDTEAPKLLKLPGVDELMTIYPFRTIPIMGNKLDPLFMSQ